VVAAGVELVHRVGMNPRIIGLMATQHGLVTRRQALDAGMAPERIDRLVRQGDLVAVRRGVYAEAAYVASLTTFRDKRLLADRAACLRISRPHVRSHDSAAHELDLAILRPSDPMTHVTRPGIVGSHNRFGVKHHLAPYAIDRVVEVGGIAVLGPARTGLDIAREHGLRAGVVAIDSARRAGATLTELELEVALMRSWPEVTVAREAIDLSDPDTDSIGETLMLELVTELGYGRPQTQFGLTANGRTAWCDQRLGRHLFEFDGEVKYHRVEDGGFAIASAEEVVWREKQRQDWLCGFKLGMSRVVWADHFGAARELALERLRREYLDTCRRFGTSIDDLTPYLARGPRPRPGRRAA
jgi:hypothetical protein